MVTVETMQPKYMNSNNIRQQVYYSILHSEHSSPIDWCLYKRKQVNSTHYLEKPGWDIQFRLLPLQELIMLHLKSKLEFSLNYILNFIRHLLELLTYLKILIREILILLANLDFLKVRQHQLMQNKKYKII